VYAHVIMTKLAYVLLCLFNAITQCFKHAGIQIGFAYIKCLYRENTWN